MSEDRWLTWLKRLHALAGTGIHFGDSDYDVERFTEINALAEDMLAALGNARPEQVRNLFPDHAQGYATPKLDIRGAVFRNGQILLVQERSDGRWCLPGGYCEVGLSPRANIEKEVVEESGLVVTATRLIALHHKAAHAYTADPRDFYKLLYLCEQSQPGEPTESLETADARFFDRDAIPELSEGRTIQADLELAWAHYADPSLPCSAD